MEHAPLRPVPSRPAGPIDPATAVRELAAALPQLSSAEARALALVGLAERPRAEVAESLDVDQRELGVLLAGARKELRRTVAVLGGSGWCERAEKLISDRLDGELSETDSSRLDVHLRNCPRCVEHERRLVQATDGLMFGLAPQAPPPVQPAAPLEEVKDEPTVAEPAVADGSGTPATEAAPSEASVEEIDEAPAAEDAPAAPLAPAGPTPGQVAAAAEVLVTSRTRRQVAAALTWNALVVLAVLLTLATIGLTVAGILGAEL